MTRGGVKRLVAGVALGTTIAGAALIVALVIQPGRRALEVDIFVLVVGAMVVLAAVIATQETYPVDEGSALAAALEREPHASVRPPDLERTERLLSIAATTAFDLHHRLCPVLREVAEQRLADRRGLVLESDDPRVREALGDDLWELVRPDREPPEHRYAPGLPHPTMRRAIERLESVT